MGYPNRKFRVPLVEDLEGNDALAQNEVSGAGCIVAVIGGLYLLADLAWLAITGRPLVQGFTDEAFAVAVMALGGVVSIVGGKSKSE